jgi:GT2 family glycosyltransferase
MKDPGGKSYIRHQVRPVEPGVRRPLWSVMIPTFNCAGYLRETLQSVLLQDPGPDQMQIEVVDDASGDRPEEVVAELGKGRVSFHRKPKGEGSYANFNTCIDRSAGHLVHILHGDDFVLPGFYRAIEGLEKAHPDTAFLASRTVYVDEAGRWTFLSPRLPSLETPSRDPAPLFYENPMQFAGVVVRRSHYEEQGGFLTNLTHAADWDRWVRAIHLGLGIQTPQVLAAYRIFPQNASGRQRRLGKNLEAIRELMEIFEAEQPTFNPRFARAKLSNTARDQEMNFLGAGDEEAAAHSRRFWRGYAPLKSKIRWWIQDRRAGR